MKPGRILKKLLSAVLIVFLLITAIPVNSYISGSTDTNTQTKAEEVVASSPKEDGTTVSAYDT